MRMLLVLALAAVTTGIAAQTRLVFETAENLRPFASIVAARIRAAELDAEIRYAPAARLVEDMRSGSIDGAFFVSESALASTPLFVRIPVPLYRNDYVAVSLVGGQMIRKPEDLEDQRVAFVRGNAALASLGRNARESFPTVDEEQAFRLLGAGRVQVVLSSRTSVQLFGGAAGVALLVHEPPLLSAPLFLGVKQALTAEREALTRVLKASVDDGSWARDVKAVIEGLSKR